MTPARGKIPFYIWPASFTLLAIIGYTFLWNTAANRMQSFVEEWVTDQRKAGLSINHGDMRTHGFPFFLRTSIDNVEIGQKESWTWGSDRLDIDVLPYDFRKIVFSPTGTQTLLLPQAASPWQRWNGTAENIRASLGRDKKREWFFILEFQHGVAKANDTQLTMETFLLNVGPAENNADTITTSILITDASGKSLLQNTNQSLSFTNFQLATNVTHTDKVGGEMGLQGWSEQGGSLEIARFILEDTPSQLVATGQLSVDRQGFPNGRIDTRLIKPGNFANTIKSSGLLEAEQADAMAGGLAIAALSGGGVIETPILLQKGKLIVRGAVVGDLPNLQ